MFRRSYRLPLATSIAALLAAAATLPAADLTWDITPGNGTVEGGAGLWDLDPLNTVWTADAGVSNIAWTNPVTFDNAIFGGTAGVVNVNAAIQVQNLTFNSNGYTISDADNNGTLTLVGATPTVTVTAAGDLATISEIIAGTVGMSKAGAGTLLVSAANTYTGTTTISAGTLRAGSGTALGSQVAGSENTIVAAGATLDVNGQNLGSEVVTISGTGVGGAGAIVNTGAAQITALRFVTLAANASIGGTSRWDMRGTTPTLNMGGFTLTKTGTNDVHLVGITVTNPGHFNITQGQLAIETTTALGGTATNTVTVASGATLSQYQNNVAQAWTVTLAGGARWYNESGTSAWAGPVVLSSGAVNFEGAAGTAHNLSGIVSGAGGITKIGTGTLTVSGSNTYTGTTAVNAGRMVISNLNRSTVYTVATGATLEMNVASGTRDMAVASNLSGTGVFQKTGAGILQWGATAATFSFGSGALIDVAAGTLVGGSNNNEVWTNNLADLNVATGATFDGVEANVRVDALTGGGTIKSGFTIAGHIGLTFGVDNGSGNFAGVLANSSVAGNFIKAGTGTQTLNGANTTTGITTVNGGTLALGALGSLTTSSVVVNGARFHVENAGKTLAALTANNASILGLVAQAGGTTTITGALTLTDGATISIQPIVPFGTGLGTYDLLTAGSVAGTGTISADFNGAYGPSRMTGSVAVNGNKVQLTVTGASAALVWNNFAGTGVWDLNTTQNFANGAGNDVFKSFDSVTFNDTVAFGSAKTVNLAGVLAPSRITVDNSVAGGNYTLAAATAGAGKLAGAGSFIKTGTGTVTLGANLDYAMTGEISSGGGTIDLGGKVLPGVAKITSVTGATLSNGTVSAATVDLQGGTISAVLAGNGSLTKTTADTAILNGNNTYTGATTVSTGALQVGNTVINAVGSLGSGPVTIAAGASLDLRRSDNVTFANSYSGAGVLTFTGTNNGTGENTQTSHLISGNNSGFSGTINAVAARFTMDNANDVGTATLVTGNFGQFYVTAGTYNNNFTISGDGWGETTGQLGAIRLQGGTLAGTITLAGNSRITSHGGSGTISGPIVGNFGLTFGTLDPAGAALTNITLSGASTYNGPTAIGNPTTGNNASITLTGSLGATAVTVNPTSTLNGKGSIGAGGSLAFATGATNFGYDARTAGALSVGGDLAFNGTTSVNLTVGSALPVGTPLTLLTYSGTATGTAANLSLPNAATYRSAIFNVTGGAVTLDLGTKALTWSGSGGATWAIGGAITNWNDAAPAPSTYFNGDQVTFNDTPGVDQSVTLAGSLQPSKLTVNNSTVTYTLTASTGNIIAGGTSLLKTGTGTLTMAGAVANTYASGTTLSQGAIDVQNAGSLGTGTVTLGDGSTGANNVSLYLATNRSSFAIPVVVSNNGTGTATLGSRATVTGSGDNNQFTNINLQRDVIFDSNAADRTDYENISGTGNITITGTNRTIFPVANSFVGNITVSLTGSAAATFQSGVATAGNQNFIPDTANLTVNDAVGNTNAEYRLSSGGESINGLNGNGTIDVNSVAGTLTVGATNGNGAFSGVMQNGGASVFSFGKAGTGTQILTGANAYTGTTTVTAGTLQVGDGGTTGQLGTGAVTVAAAGTLTYLRSGAVTQAGALNSAALGAGTLNVNGGAELTLNAGGNFSGVINVNNGTLIYGATNPTNTAANAPTINLAAGTTLTTGLLSTHAHIGNITMNGATWTTGGGTATYNTENFQLNGTVTIAGTIPSVITREASRLDANSGVSLNGVRTFNVGDVTGNAAADLTVSTELENTDTSPADDGFIKAGAGTMVLANLNSFNGPTTVNAGDLLVSGSLSGTGSITLNGGKLTAGSENPINNAATLTMGGGTLDSGDFNLTMGALTLSGSSTIELGGSSSIVHLANSSASLWQSGAILTISGWNGLAAGNGNDQIFFGVDASGLGSINLAAIRFLNPDGQAPGLYAADILPTGELIAVPEPASIGMLVGGLGVLLGMRRRRKG